jgi:hypothetical protein
VLSVPLPLEQALMASAIERRRERTMRVVLIFDSMAARASLLAAVEDQARFGSGFTDIAPRFLAYGNR